MDPPQPPRLVLDTNVCLDLFLFEDPAVQPLHQCLLRGRAHAVDDAVCRAEWLRVLGYPTLRRDLASLDRAREQYAALIRPWADTVAATPPSALPRCADPDDQKFLELSARCAARVLVTRDASLLCLSRRTLLIAGFVIAQPNEATAFLETLL